MTVFGSEFQTAGGEHRMAHLAKVVFMFDRHSKLTVLKITARVCIYYHYGAENQLRYMERNLEKLICIYL